MNAVASEFQQIHFLKIFSRRSARKSSVELHHHANHSSFGQLIQDFEKAATPTAAQPYLQDLMDALHLAKKGQGITVQGLSDQVRWF